MARKNRRGGRGASARAARRSPATTEIRMIRVSRKGTARAATASAAAAAAPEVPIAMIATNGGPVTVGIAFGQAQHAQYTIQLFDPTGVTELTRESGLNTDSIPDQFTLQATPAQLDQHILQWSGLISAFSPAPGQAFSVTFEVAQGGSGVPGGRVPRTGALAVTQPFVGVLRLVTR